jgi:hypothetical protein
MMRKIQCVYTATILALLLLGSFGPRFALAGVVTYQVGVDTSALSGQGGNLDFQFNPGGLDVEGATATVTNFQMIGGILSQPAMLSGDASGSLPGTLTLDNGSVYNDVFQGLTYGDQLSFLLTLSGPAIDSPGGMFGSSFALSLYDAAGTTPLLTTDPNGSVLTTNLNADGSTSSETFPQSPTNSAPVAVAVATSAVPEPTSFVMFVSALPVTLIAWGNARRQARAG